MNWFYEENGKPMGPVSGSTLVELILSGRVPRESLVWREGFDGWKPASSVAELLAESPMAAPPSLAAGPVGNSRADGCSLCGKDVTGEDLIQASGRIVCAACKPKFLQQIREGVSFPGTLVFAGFGLRFAAKIIDTIIEQVLGYSLMALVGLVLFGTAGAAFNQPATAGDGAYAAYAVGGFLVTSALGAILHGWMLVRWQATPGKLACGLRVVRPDGARLGFWRGFARYFAEMLSALFCLIGYFMSVFDEEKRTLHDRICETRVVMKN